MKNRSQNDIMKKILSSSDGCNQSALLVRTNLSTAQLKQYVGFLAEHGLMIKEQVNKEIFYKTTEKGYRFLKIVDGISSYGMYVPDKRNSLSL